MALLLQLLFVLTALVVFVSGQVCYYLSKRYDSILEAKFPAMIQSLSTWRRWQRWKNPFIKIRRWRKAIKLGDDELTKVAKRCCLLTYIGIASGICLILLGIMLSYVL